MQLFMTDQGDDPVAGVCSHRELKHYITNCELYCHCFSLKFKFMSAAVAVATNKREISKDWEWLEQHLMQTLSKYQVSLLLFLWQPWNRLSSKTFTTTWPLLLMHRVHRKNDFLRTWKNIEKDQSDESILYYTFSLTMLTD